MIDPALFAERQTELASELAKYLLDHPEVDEALPEDAYIYFQIGEETEINDNSRQLSMRHRDTEGREIVCVRVRGLAPPQGSRLIEPNIGPTPSAASR